MLTSGAARLSSAWIDAAIAAVPVSDGDEPSATGGVGVWLLSGGF